MKNQSLSLILFAAIVVSACSPIPVTGGEAAMADEESMIAAGPSVTVRDQTLMNSTLLVPSYQTTASGEVLVPEVVSSGQGWIVIHADKDGAPGPVIGYSMVADGLNKNVKVAIDTSMATETLFAMLHTDAGELGTYEFPGADVPVMNKGVMVNKPFMALESVYSPY